MSKKTVRYFPILFIFPIFLFLSACNDSKDDQVGSSTADTSKKPVMRCAP